MSLKSFLTKIWSAITRLFDGLDDELQSAVQIGVSVVQNLKKLIDAPVADMLTAIIPGELDDRLKNWLREQLPHIFQQLKLADERLTDGAEIIKAAIAQLKSLEGNAKNAFLHNLSIIIAQVAADGKLTWEDAVYVLQWYYQHRVKQK